LDRLGPTCDRCGAVPIATVMSYFNLDVICLNCKGDERGAPGYRNAVEAEAAALRRGETNYPGAGLSDADRAYLAGRLLVRRGGGSS
jgi:hypothetical protein